MLTQDTKLNFLFFALAYTVSGIIVGYFVQVAYIFLLVLSAYWLVSKFQDVPAGKTMISLIAVGIFFGGIVRWLINPIPSYANVEGLTWTLKIIFAFLPSLAFYIGSLIAWKTYARTNKQEVG